MADEAVRETLSFEVVGPARGCPTPTRVNLRHHPLCGCTWSGICCRGLPVGHIQITSADHGLATRLHELGEG